ncbi:MAG: FAD-dependent oxidoreductase [Desulfurococcaceae archaeon]
MRFTFMCKEKPASINTKIAIVGAGPAGLAASGYLACQGYEIDVYDKLPLPGGLMLFAIPPWRIPRENVLTGVKELEERFGVKFYNKVKVYTGESTGEEGDMFVEKRISLEELVENYHAVLIASGTWASKIPKIPGIEAKNVLTALEYLLHFRLYELGLSSHPPLRGKRVIIIGGGYSAVDAAEQAVRAGAEVILAYRRTIREAPAGLFEMERIKREGVHLLELVSPVEIIVENGYSKGVKFQRMRLGPVDKTGRPQPIPVPGSEFVLDADLIVFATGETPTPPFQPSEDILKKLNIELSEDRTIVVNRIYQTKNPKVFAAGDIVNGPTRIGPAIKSGLYAARFMHNWLQAVIVKTSPSPR